MHGQDREVEIRQEDVQDFRELEDFGRQALGRYFDDVKDIEGSVTSEADV